MSEEPVTEREDESDGHLGRRAVLKYGGTGAVTAGLAGCQSRKNPLPGGQLRVPPDDDPRPGPEGTPDGEGLLAGETVRIGVLAPMNLPLGQSLWDGARLAAEQHNESGGLLGATVETVLHDTKVSPARAAAGHRRLIARENCDITCGIFLGSALMQTMPSIANQEKIHITTASADPRPGKLVSKSNSEITGTSGEEEYERFKYHFRAGPIHLLDLADAMLEYVQNVKDQEVYDWDTAALLTENLGEFTPYHTRLTGNLSDIVDVPVTSRPGGVSDWSPLYNEIEGTGCDVAIIGMALGGTSAVIQWHNQERNFEFGGIHVPSQAYDYWESTSGKTEWVFTMNAMTPQTANTPRTQDFVQSYIERFDRVPIYTAPLTYDSITLLEQTLRTVMQEEGIEGRVPEADTMIPYMEEMTYTGSTIIEEFQFTPSDATYAHEPLWTSIAETGVPVFQQWQYDPEVREDYGTMHSVYPEQNKTSDYQQPDWLGGS